MSQRTRVGVLISGRGSNMQALVRAARAPDCPFEIVLVLSENPDAAGLAWAREHGVAAEAVDRRLFGRDREAHERTLQARLTSAGVELVALAGYMRLLTPWFVSAWSGRLLNIHPSLLPKHPGLHTHQRALDAGDAEAGCTVHLVIDEVDAGEVLGQARVPVLPGDDADTLAARVLEQEHRLYPAVLAQFVRHLPSPSRGEGPEMGVRAQG